MSVWDLREAIERAIPAWVPLLIVSVVIALLIIDVAYAIRHRRRKR